MVLEDSQPRPEAHFPDQLLHHLDPDKLPAPRDFSRPTSNYTRKNDVKFCSHMHKQILTASTLAEKLLLLLPTLETRLDLEQTQTLANAFALKHHVPTESRFDYREASPFIAKFLSSSDLENWHNVWRAAPSFWLCQDTPLELPHDPIPHRIKGPSKDTPRLGVEHDTPSLFLIFHFVWSFLTITDRCTIINMHPIMRDYARLRSSATLRPVTSVLLKRPHPSAVPPLCHRRAWIMSCALLRFNFVYADLIRWLGGEYTNDHRDWKSVAQLADLVSNIPVPVGNPPIHPDQAIHIATSGAPIAGHFKCKFDDVAKRERYDNHHPLEQAQTEVRN